MLVCSVDDVKVKFSVVLVAANSADDRATLSSRVLIGQGDRLVSVGESLLTRGPAVSRGFIHVVHGLCLRQQSHFLYKQSLLPT